MEKSKQKRWNFKNSAEKEGQAVRLIACDTIAPSPYQPRRTFAPEALKALSESIAEYGVLQPLLVKEQADGKYSLIAGERRLRAAKMAGLKVVPCLVSGEERKVCAQITMIENLQREDLSYWEVAEGYRKIIETFGLTQEQLAEKMHVSQSSVANKLRLLKLPPAAQTILASHNLSERHARALLRLPEREQIYHALQAILEKNLTVAETDLYVSKMIAPSVTIHRKTPIIKDRRLCMNTLRKAVGLIQKAGIKATTSTKEHVDFIEYIIRIPKTS